MAAVSDNQAAIYNAAVQGTPDNPLGVPSNVAAYMVGQAQTETANFTSNFFVNYNNAFGFSASPTRYWQAGSTPGVADNGLEAAVYTSVANSARDVVDWLYSHGATYQQMQSMSASDYAAFLYDNGYFTSSPASYAADIEAYISSFVAPAVAVGSSLSLLDWMILAAAAYLVYRVS